ncbi:MAG: hypothetical protein ACFFCW_49535, partial [Candidatus Hodarchaeota archaeon]
LRRVVGIITICFAAVLASVNHNVSYENRIPTLIIIGLFAIGGWTLYSGRKPRIEGQERQAIGQRTRRSRQENWLAGVLFAFFLIPVGSVILSKIPAPTRANKNGSVFAERKRNLSTPSGRLWGHWVGVPNGGSLYYPPINHSLGYGTYTWELKSNIVVQFKVLSESRSGIQLNTREFFQLDNGRCCANVEYCISKDGQSMTREILFEDGSRALFEYRYVDGRISPSMPEGFVLVE